MSTAGYLTCIACRLIFTNPQHQRQHYQSDLHRFNLKRQAAGLPPVSEDIYQEKVAQQKLLEENQNVKSSLFCSDCNKSFGSENTYKQHMASRKHLDRASKSTGNKSTIRESSDSSTSSTSVVSIEVDDKSEEELIEEKLRNAVEIKITECLFCARSSPTIEQNLNHMAYEHGFFLPFMEYVDDLNGLVEYLGQKIGTGNTCLKCHKMFRTIEAVRQHMVMSNHCRIKWEGSEDELIDWYDFDRKPNNENESSEDSDQSSTAASAAVDNDESNTPTLSNTGYSMILGDGSVVGHRDLALYYRQRFKRPETRDSVLIQRLMSQYQTLGYVNPVGKWQTSVMKKTERRDQFWWNKFNMRLGVKANKLQHHYREQNPL